MGREYVCVCACIAATLRYELQPNIALLWSVNLITSINLCKNVSIIFKKSVGLFVCELDQQNKPQK